MRNGGDMSATLCCSLLSAASVSLCRSSSICGTLSFPRHQPFLLRLRVARNDADTSSQVPSDSEEQSDADKLVDGMNFGELCNEFECISSPSVESTARQLARDILDLREGNQAALATFAISVRYRDPLRSFTGRDKYKRPLWATAALNNPSVSVQEMVMLSTSVLSIKWTVRGKPKSLIPGAGDVILRVTSRFTLNQISGQVIEHQESWDLSPSSALAQAFFWTSRALYATLESAKDLADISHNFTRRLSNNQDNNLDIYPDPTKFFQRDDGFQQDAYQIALLLALLYFLVQFLRTTL